MHSAGTTMLRLCWPVASLAPSSRVDLLNNSGSWSPGNSSPNSVHNLIQLIPLTKRAGEWDTGEIFTPMAVNGIVIKPDD